MNNMYTDVLVKGKRIDSPADLFEKSRNLKKANQVKADLSTFEEIDQREDRKTFRTKEDVQAYDSYWAFEEEDLTPRKKIPTIEDLYGEIVEGDCIGEDCNESNPINETFSIVVSGVNREKVRKNSDWYSNSSLENGKFGIAKEVESWKYEFPHEHAQKKNVIAKGPKAPKNLRSKPKGKMRKSEWKKLADKIIALDPRQIEHLLLYGQNPIKTLLKHSA